MVSAAVSVPLSRLALCLDCEQTFPLRSSCPACGSEHFVLVVRFFEREVRAA